MPEIKEKSADVSSFVEESTSRLHDMDRRLQSVQSSLASLSNMANLFGAPGLPSLGFAAPGREGLGLYGLPILGPYGSAPVGSVPSFLGGMGGAVPGATSGVVGTFPAQAQVYGAGAGPWGAPNIPMGEALTGRDLGKLPAVAKIPECNLIDGGTNFILQIELPGVKKDDLEITASERAITVHALSPSEPGDGTVILGERLPVAYRRTVNLPSTCNVAQAKATLKDGFLTLKVPKKEPTDAPKKLDVAYG